MKSALMVMYSSVSSYCHPQMLLTYADSPITTKIIHHYSSSCQVTHIRCRQEMSSLSQEASHTGCPTQDTSRSLAQTAFGEPMAHT